MSDQTKKSAEDWVPVAPPIPAHWSYVDFDEAFDAISTNGIKIPEAQYAASGRFPIVDQGKSFVGGYTDTDSNVINQDGTVIVFGDHTRCFKLINFPFAPGADGTKVLSPAPYLVPKFAYYGCLSLKLPDRGYSRHYSFLRKSKFPIAPVKEQERIVAKIEELFSELDMGVESLTTARAQLKVCRQSVLKHAFDGTATSTWRERNGGAQWTSITVGEASEKVVDCLHSTPRFAAVGKCCVDSTWVEDNRLLWDQARYVDEATYHERIRRLKPERGDVILVREGSKKIGTALAVNFDDDFCLGQRMMMFRLRDGILPQYFVYYIQSDNFKKQYKPLIGGSASPHLNISDIKRMRLPLCSPGEQKEVVGFIDSQSSVIDALEATIVVEIEKSQALRQSILKRAFSGQLVAQDPADEPASVLLRCIRAEQEDAGHGRRKNNKNGTKEAA